jgi:hypothetical protein
VAAVPGDVSPTPQKKPSIPYLSGLGPNPLRVLLRTARSKTRTVAYVCSFYYGEAVEFYSVNQ